MLDGRTDKHCDTFSSCRSQKPQIVRPSVMSFCVVVMSKAYRGVPSVKQPGVPAQQEMRVLAPASAGGEERRVRRGPDIRGPLDVRDPVCQSAGGGEMRRDRSRIGDGERRARPYDPEPGVGRHTLGDDGEGERIRGEESQVGRRGGLRDPPDDPEPGVGRHLRGDGEGDMIKVKEKSKPTGIGFWRYERTIAGFASSDESRDKMSASDAVQKLRSSFGDKIPPALSHNRSPGSCEGFVSASGHFIQQQRPPTFSSEQSRQSTVERKRGVNIVEGFWKLQDEISANRERYERDSKPKLSPIGRDPRKTGKWIEDTDQRSGSKEVSQIQKVALEQPNKRGNIGPRPLSDFNQCSFVRELPPVTVFVPKLGSLPEEERAEKASVVVGLINRLSRQKKGALFDAEIIGSSDLCPLCGDLNGVCLGVSCRKKKGKRVTFLVH